MSKGSARRKEDVKKIRDNWDVIFGKKPAKDEPAKPDNENAKYKDKKG